MDNFSKKRKINDSLFNFVLNENAIESGASNVSNVNFFYKKYNRDFNEDGYDNQSPFCVNSYEHYLNEINILPFLDKYNMTPKLIEHNNDSLILSNCGSVINKMNMPFDWKNQILAIYEMLVTENLYHNDFTIKNITVLNGKIYLIDFGWASYNKPSYPYFNLTKDIIENSATIYDVFEKILNNAIHVRMSNIVSFSSYINNDCRNDLKSFLL